MNTPSTFTPTLQWSRMLADAQRRQSAGDALGAAALYEQLSKANPNDHQLLGLWGEALTMLGRVDQARSVLAKALRVRPDEIGLQYALAMTWRREGRFDRAHKILDGALRLRPGDPLILSAKSGCYFTEGDFDNARATLEPLIGPQSTQSGPPHPSLAIAYARLSPKVKEEPGAIDMLRRSLAHEGWPPKLRADALFALGDLLDRVGDYQAAWPAYEQANRLRAVRFDPASFTALADDLIGRTWTARRMMQLPRSRAKAAGAAKSEPVFIVGMPRSGTSLVEQILASHPEVFGAGELNHIGRLVHEWQAALGGAITLLTDLEPFTQENLDREARVYRDAIHRLAPKARKVTDKMPLNGLHLGLISLLFPDPGGARVIHCVRDPLDTCLSCFFQNFAGLNPYAYDLTHLGLFCREYRRIVQHWKTVLELPVLDVVYEELVADQEGWSRRMIDSIGLDWDDACLRFHDSARVTLTASNDQVRRPMYSSSVGRWRNYDAHLGPLKQALGM